MLGEWLSSTFHISPRLITDFFFTFVNIKSLMFRIFPKKKISDKFFTIPYIKAVSESFRSIALKMNFKLAYTIPR